MRRVIVVGAGPAGSAAAISLRRFGGVEVCLLERAVLPRRKACGSGLSPWCLELLDGMGLGDRIRARAHPIGAARIGAGKGPALELRSGYEAAVLRREVFDTMLVREAQARGTELREGVRVTGIVRERGEVIGVRTREGELEADAVIVASGATTTLGWAHRPGHDLQTYMSWFEGVEDVIDAVELYFDPVVAPYYGWVFPESPRLVNLGIVFRPAPGGPNARERFERFVDERLGRRLRAAARVERPIGHPVRTGPRPTRLTAQGVLVAGEAGRLVDPATAEGIHHALASGWTAGAHLGELAAEGSPYTAANLAPYTARVRRAIGARLLAGHALLQLARTPVFGWMIGLGNMPGVRSLLTWTLAGA